MTDEPKTAAVRSTLDEIDRVIAEKSSQEAMEGTPKVISAEIYGPSTDGSIYEHYVEFIFRNNGEILVKTGIDSSFSTTPDEIIHFAEGIKHIAERMMKPG